MARSPLSGLSGLSAGSSVEPRERVAGEGRLGDGAREGQHGQTLEAVKQRIVTGVICIPWQSVIQ